MEFPLFYYAMRSLLLGEFGESQQLRFPVNVRKSAPIRLVIPAEAGIQKMESRMCA